MGHNRISKNPIYTVSSAGCWEWNNHRNLKGYGCLRKDGKNWLAHRYFYQARFGAIPVGCEIDHLCKNRACVNPEHVEAVSHKENIIRGRNTKLTKNAVREIRNRVPSYDVGVMKKLAIEYGVTYANIRNIVKNITWVGV